MTVTSDLNTWQEVNRRDLAERLERIVELLRRSTVVRDRRGSSAESLDDALAAIASLPPDSQAFLDAISPIRHLDGLAAPVWLMHEREDHHVPYVESRVLARTLRERGLLDEQTEFRLFDHVQPDDLDVLAAAPELWRLLLHVRELMEQSL